MAQYTAHNRMRLAAGLPIDTEYEIRAAREAAAPKVDEDAVKALVAEAMAAEREAVAELDETEEQILSVLGEGTTCPACKKLQEADPDFQAAWKLKSQANMLGRSQPDLARGQAASAAMHMKKFNDRKSELKCEDCKNGVVSDAAPVTEDYDFDGETFDSWEKDKKKPVNVVSDEETVADKPEDDRDESPSQMAPPTDTPSPQDQSGGGDARKVTVPARIKTLLRDQMREAEAAAEKVDYSNREAGYFYKDLAAMFGDLLNHLEGGTVYDIKKAQIFMTSLMGPMLHKIPAEVVNFLARGGERASLRSYMQKVDVVGQDANRLS